MTTLARALTAVAVGTALVSGCSLLPGGGVPGGGKAVSAKTLTGKGNPTACRDILGDPAKVAKEVLGASGSFTWNSNTVPDQTVRLVCGLLKDGKEAIAALGVVTIDATNDRDYDPSRYLRSKAGAYWIVYVRSDKVPEPTEAKVQKWIDSAAPNIKD